LDLGHSSYYQAFWHLAGVYKMMTRMTRTKLIATRWRKQRFLRQCSLPVWASLVNQTLTQAPTHQLMKRLAQRKTSTALAVAKEALYSAREDRVEAAIALTRQQQHGAANALPRSRKSTAFGRSLAMATTTKSNTALSTTVAAHLLAIILFQKQQHAHGLTQAAAKKLPWLTAPSRKTQLPTPTLKISAPIYYAPTPCL
jgi:hypothetical protein